MVNLSCLYFVFGDCVFSALIDIKQWQPTYLLRLKHFCAINSTENVSTGLLNNGIHVSNVSCPTPPFPAIIIKSKSNDQNLTKPKVRWKQNIIWDRQIEKAKTLELFWMKGLFFIGGFRTISTLEEIWSNFWDKFHLSRHELEG